MSAVWRRAGQLQASGIPFAAAMRQARRELDPAYDGLAAAVVESQRVENVCRALGMDIFGINAVQERIAELWRSTTCTWREATDQVLAELHRA